MHTDASQPAEIKPKFRVGEWVAYTSGLSRHVAEVIEDCGPVGVRGRRFYRLREPIWYGEPVEYELPETILESATLDDKERLEEPGSRPSPYDIPGADYE